MTKRISLLSMLAAILALLISSAHTQRPEPKKMEVRGHTMYTLLEPGGIPAIFDPEFVSIKTADSFYYDDEPLIAVSSGNVARGYSTWHLDHHEIVNDVLEGTAIAVTW